MEHNDKVYITLDRPRELWFGHKAQKQLQAIFHVAPESIDTRAMDSEMTERLMYCMLLRDAEAHGETLKIEDMEDLLDYARPGKIIRKMNEALIAAYAPDEEDKLNGWGGNEPEEEPDPRDPIEEEP